MFRFVRSCLPGLPAVAGLAFIACSSSSPREGFDPGTPDTGTSSGQTSGGFSPDAGIDASQDGCSDEAKLVYVLSLEGDLWSFAPADKKFTKVGPLNCKESGGLGGTLTPISMAVDRSAVAWVNLRPAIPIDGDVMFKVDTTNAACTETKIKGNIGGMGFSVNAGTTDQETLFVVGDGNTQGQSALVKVDTKAETMTPIHDLPGDGELELTGTGDGRLYAFITNGMSLAQVDKGTSAFSSKVSLSKVEQPQSPMYAFSFWGGDFYIYTATDPGTSKSTNVTRYRPSDGSIDTAYMQNIGFHIVGAGVSTCAPTTSPK
jgi:hypothetical protein